MAGLLPILAGVPARSGQSGQLGPRPFDRVDQLSPACVRKGGGDQYQSIKPVVTGDGAILRLRDALHGPAGVLGVISDEPAITTFYATCVGAP